MLCDSYLVNSLTNSWHNINRISRGIVKRIKPKKVCSKIEELVIKFLIRKIKKMEYV